MAMEYAVIDCETDPFKEGRIPEPFLWGFYHPDTGVLYFHHISQLMEFLSDKTYRIYAHNGGKFDFHYMLEYIENWQKITMINNRLAKWEWKGCEFRDSYCILPVPLSAYNKTEIDYADFEKERRDIPEVRAEIEAYLADDLRFTYELISAFIEENGVHLTIASCAIKKLQKIEGLKINNSGRKLFEEISPYYFGGRVECFKKGIIRDAIKCYDINSAYPYAMLHPHPIESYTTRHSKNPVVLGSDFYTFTALSLGGLPYRNEAKTLEFPSDGERRTFHVTGWEVIECEKLGLLREVRHIEQKHFPATKDFTKYVNHYYTIKATSKKGSPKNIFAKLFLNSSYGKFGADPSRYRDTYLIPSEDFMEARLEGFDIHSELHGRLIISKPNDEETWRHYNVATAASITGFVRAYLLRALRSVDGPIYCDTDSLTFTGDGDLLVGDDLGQWKHEGDFDIAGIGGKKIYAMKNSKTGDEKTACKGVRLDFDEIMRVCKGEIIARTPDNPVFSIKKGKYFLKKTIAMT